MVRRRLGQCSKGLRLHAPVVLPDGDGRLRAGPIRPHLDRFRRGPLPSDRLAAPLFHGLLRLPPLGSGLRLLKGRRLAPLLRLPPLRPLPDARLYPAGPARHGGEGSGPCGRCAQPRPLRRSDPLRVLFLRTSLEGHNCLRSQIPERLRLACGLGKTDL